MEYGITFKPSFHFIICVLKQTKTKQTNKWIVYCFFSLCFSCNSKHVLFRDVFMRIIDEEMAVEKVKKEKIECENKVSAAQRKVSLVTINQIYPINKCSITGLYLLFYSSLYVICLFACLFVFCNSVNKMIGCYTSKASLYIKLWVIFA